ncbi:MAG: 50S ribosomal protein L4 [Bacteroidota bacterium]|nr:50S ribosomal protein L4 [Bacteroidota bacterium]MDP4190674.1 50S ribosomal protein L4 [Bacteroidota bacterium]MDP4194072.1 50S ribosomal protein L4 [Bacteroidota bacterium]
MTLDVFKIDGSKSGKSVELAEEIFNAQPNNTAIYLSVKAFLANQRQGTHKSKERSEVSGGGKKPWRQKGRGGARAGTTRSPLWVGGGTVFGPRPRKYRQDINKKVNKLAKKSALSLKAQNNQIVVIEDFNFESPKTKELVSILNNLKVYGRKTLLLTDGSKTTVYKSGRNIAKVNVLEAQKASTYDLVNNQVLIMQESALKVIENSFN